MKQSLWICDFSPFLAAGHECRQHCRRVLPNWISTKGTASLRCTNRWPAPSEHKPLPYRRYCVLRVRSLEFADQWRSRWQNRKHPPRPSLSKRSNYCSPRMPSTSAIPHWATSMAKIGDRHSGCCNNPAAKYFGRRMAILFWYRWNWAIRTGRRVLHKWFPISIGILCISIIH